MFNEYVSGSTLRSAVASTITAAARHINDDRKVLKKYSDGEEYFTVRDRDNPMIEAPGVGFEGSGASCTISGTKANGYVSARIKLPAYQVDRLYTASQANRAVGYAMHELAHAAYTNNGCITANDWARAHTSPVLYSFINAVEDARIERQCDADGYAHNFPQLVGPILREAVLNEGYDPSKIGSLPLTLAVVLRQYSIGEDWIMRKLGPMRPAVEAALEAWKSVPVQETREVGLDHSIRVVKAVFDKLDELREQAAQPQPQQQQPEKQDGGKPEKQDGDKAVGGSAGDAGEDGDAGDAGGAGDDGKSGEAGGDSEAGDKDGAGAASGGDGDHDAGTTSTAKGGGDSDGEVEVGDSGAAECDDADAGVGDGFSRNTGNPLDYDVTTITDFNQANIVCKISEDETDCGWPLLPILKLDDDLVERLNMRRKDRLSTEMVRKVDFAKNFKAVVKSISSRDRLMIRRLFTKSDIVGYRRNMKAGSLNRRALASTAAGREDIFQRRGDTDGISTDVAIIGDLSGSMAHGSTIKTQANAMLMLSECLAPIQGVRHGVFGFYGVALYNRDSTKATIGQSVIQFRGFTDQQTVARRTIAVSRSMASGGTPIGSGIRTMTNMLRNSNARSKIMMIISDGGFPSSEVEDAIDEAESHGIKVIGIGVRCYMPGFKSYAVCSAESIGTTLVKQIVDIGLANSKSEQARIRALTKKLAEENAAAMADDDEDEDDEQDLLADEE